MENTSQTSLEYLIMLGLVVVIATLAMVLTGRIFTIKDSLMNSIKEFRETTLQIK